MSDFNISMTGATTLNEVKTGDRFLTNNWKGVKKLLICATAAIVINDYKVSTGTTIIEFPQIGSSLPCVFTVSYVNGEGGYSTAVAEYGGQPDPDYFNITGVDEQGEPLYV